MFYIIFLICVVTHIDSAVGKSDLKQHWKDISFELISNLSEESSEGNKRSKISEDSLELSNESGSNISFESEESESNESETCLTELILLILKKLTLEPLTTMKSSARGKMLTQEMKWQQN